MAFSYSNNNLSNPDRINLNVLTEITSLNSPKRTGVYYVTGENIGDLPPGFSNYGILLCMRSPYSLHPTNSNCVYVQEYTDTYGNHASRSFNNGAWTNWITAASKDDLGVTEFNGGKTIAIDGTLSGIGKWINSQGFTARWRSARCNPNNQGYFGRSTFCILWQCSSTSYGWCILMSDNSKMVVFGRNSDGWHWYAPSLSEVS